MGRKSSLHLNKNSLLCLAKEPKTVFLYGKENKWFEEADKGGFMLEHESNDAVKLIALTCALHSGVGKISGYQVPENARNILKESYKNGWSISSTVKELRRMKKNVDIDNGCLDLTTKFSWLKEHGILVCGTESDSVLQRECIAEELHMAEHYRSDTSANGCYISAMLQSKGSTNDRNCIAVKYGESVPAEGLRISLIDGKAHTVSGDTVKITLARPGQKGGRALHHIEIITESCSGLENCRLKASDYLDDRTAESMGEGGNL